jgi:hypothetical protein
VSQASAEVAEGPGEAEVHAKDEVAGQAWAQLAMHQWRPTAERPPHLLAARLVKVSSTMCATSRDGCAVEKRAIDRPKIFVID